MAEDTFWNVGEDQEVVRYGELALAVVRAPFPGGSVSLPAHDPERAREFVAAFGTVDAVREELLPASATEPVDLATRADLDVVRVGCWGGVTEIVDAALGNVGDDFPVWEQAQALRKRYPDAVVIGAATVEHDSTYGARAVLHADGPSVFAAGWHGEGDWDLQGDVRAVVEAFWRSATARASTSTRWAASTSPSRPSGTSPGCGSASNTPAWTGRPGPASRP